MTRRGSKGLIAGGVVALVALGLGYALIPPSEEAPLASAGPESVVADDFKRRYVAYLLSSGVPDKPALRRRFQQGMIASRLLIHEAREDGMEQDEAFQRRKEQLGRKLLLDTFVRAAVLDSLTVAEEEVREMFVRAHTQLTARRLCARTRAEAYGLAAAAGSRRAIRGARPRSVYRS